ncbi:unnamed protein product [Echinostoma caproni]|uniref:Uncharacterized protein n=1 Tax=Echinostoma caproni TaxID=27848 RepID=A0A183AD34_9TREM|nr:unnamed protein product [Echinostoma caproni]
MFDLVYDVFGKINCAMKLMRSSPIGQFHQFARICQLKRKPMKAEKVVIGKGNNKCSLKLMKLYSFQPNVKNCRRRKFGERERVHKPEQHHDSSTRGEKLLSGRKHVGPMVDQLLMAGYHSGALRKPFPTLSRTLIHNGHNGLSRLPQAGWVYQIEYYLSLREREIEDNRGFHVGAFGGIIICIDKTGRMNSALL